MRNEGLRFSLTVPDGFEAVTAEEEDPALLYAFAASEAGNDASLFVLTVERLGETIPKSVALDQDDARAARQLAEQFAGEAEVTPIVVQWQGYYLELNRDHGTDDGGEYVRYAADIPLKREAIRLTLRCDSGSSDMGRRLVEQLVGGLEGATNWSGEGLGEFLRGRLLLKIVGAIVGPALIYILVKSLRRPAGS